MIQVKKITTNTAKEWIDALKLHWDLSKTQMRENEEDVLVMHFGKSSNLMIAYYSKTTKSGYVIDRRSKIRDNK